MSKPKLIVLEGPDSTGKTSQLKYLAQHYSAKIVVQPSEDNNVGFLRSVVKNDTEMTPTERQLLHTISHVFDAHEKFDMESNIIMDRCHLSALVYGKVTGVSDRMSQLIQDIHRAAYTEVALNYDIHVVFMTRYERYNSRASDNFEKTFSWDMLKTAYDSMYEIHSKFRRIFTFPESTFPQEHIHRIDVGTLSSGQVTDEIIRMVGN